MICRITAALAATLFMACTHPSAVNSTVPDPTVSGSPVSDPAASQNLPEVVAEPLPEILQERVRAAHADYRGIPLEQTRIVRYSRETWQDGCLGLGGPAESCLAALTEGWQISVADTAADNEDTFYRTDLTGDSIRRSTLENNLPPSVGDRILHTLRTSGVVEGDTLSIVAAEPQLWDGCYGLPTGDGVCTEVGILGWRAIATDGQRYWIYHTDGPGNTILLNETASGTTAIPSFIERFSFQNMGEETLFQETIVDESQATREIRMLEGDRQLFHHLPTTTLEQTEAEQNTERYQISARKLEVFSEQLGAINFEHLDGLHYRAADPDLTGTDNRLIELQSWQGVVQYTEEVSQPEALQTIRQDWAQL
ncbi:MAG: hypothetical protein AAF152_04795 [Cyanobacteria bacterium P01_A01_bin.114]